MTDENAIDAPVTSGPWERDVLGDEFVCRTLELGDDPDGEGPIVATLVRHESGAWDIPHPDGDRRPPVAGGAEGTRRPAVLYVHGLTDYFFQVHVAEFFAARGYRFYALDLRKCGRSRRGGQTPHDVSDLALYDRELDAALDVVREDGATEVIAAAHSTGGLVLPLWLDRRRREGRVAPGPDGDGLVTGLILNSPWFDLQGPPILRSAGTLAIDAIGRVKGSQRIPLPAVGTYGDSIHRSAHGEWDYDLDWKPTGGTPLHFGWLRAVRRGHARLHRGLDVGVPTLVLRSTRSFFASKYSPEADRADVVLDVRQIQRWSGCLGERTLVAPIPDARHDVFLSIAPARERAFAEIARWLDDLAWTHEADERQRLVGGPTRARDGAAGKTSTTSTDRTTGPRTTESTR